MNEFVLALVPDYGLFVVFIVVALACLGAPLPSSMLVLASGGFAATGDLAYWQVVFVTLSAFVLGDQFAFRISSQFGPSVLARFKRVGKVNAIVEKSETLLQKHGLLAVLLSHTIASPTGPYVTYICGASRMSYLPFSLVATLGAGLWTVSYVSIGYVFAGNLSLISNMSKSLTITIIAIVFMFLFGWWLRKAWKSSL